MSKIKKVRLGTTNYDICDASAKRILSARKFIFIGDSYLNGEGLGGVTFGYGEKLKNLLGIDATLYPSSGGGLLATGNNGTFLTIADNLTVDNDVTDVFVIGFINDAVVDFTNLSTVLETFITTLQTKCPNATIHLGALSDYERTLAANDARNSVISIIRNGTSLGYCYIDNIEHIMKQTSLYQTDKVHPTTEGQDVITNCLANYIINGNLSIDRGMLNVVLSNPSIGSGAMYMRQHQHNNVITICNTGTARILPKSWNTTLDGEFGHSYAIGGLTDSFAYGRANEAGLSLAEWVVPINIIVTGYASYTVPCKFMFKDNVLYAMPILIVNGGWFSGTVVQMEIPMFTAMIDSALA